MIGKIALEEHFVSEDAKAYLPALGVRPEVQKRIDDGLVDVEQYRLPDMDAHGVEMQLVSLTADGVQIEPDRDKAAMIASRANDELAERFVARHPTRFAGFAAVALQDPKAAADELERAVKQLGFVGALANGFSNIGDLDTGEYYDLRKFLPFWERVADLGVPFYLHPRGPLDSQQMIYDGHKELLGPAWAFGVETATHALRLITSGLFDRFPKLTIVIGHLGEGLIPMMWRFQNRFDYASFGRRLQKPVAQYLKDNFYITTSGNFHTPTLLNVIAEIGADRVMFAIDYPYERTEQAVEWFDHCAISEEDRQKIGRLNAQRLFKLSPAHEQEGQLHWRSA
ncbi:amidohydrolase 2 [Methylocella silvestris BL2]|uniref:Amidohydrolase 2 n=1 Tax=Methylocella silvestris (strain DSM 15510 / CIP 108128 / LMG 27833 / NCIMB 13906 / BL2) TaxID=395965 RepID=B8ETN7_METSB|nr:amidohydrolase family protein [Methylocella silvestris]ACK52389.1 amidohydrolase 2 [Methylocella silvestris BL2]